MRATFFVIFLIPLLLYGDWGPEDDPGTPWYTGSLFSTTGISVPVGVYSLQEYLFVTDGYADYTKNFSLRNRPDLIEYNPIIQFQTGIFSGIDTQFTLQTTTRQTQRETSTQFGDFVWQMGFQLIRSSEGDNWLPNLRLTITETFPTGKYQKLDPKKKGTDLGGGGSFQTNISLNLQQIYFLHTRHPTRMRINVGANIQSNIPVKGLNVYGGSIDTKGKVKPGSSLFFIYSPEITLTYNWVFTFDLTYTHTFISSFSGDPGRGRKEALMLGTIDIIAFAPAIEYNFSNNFGLIFGGWFSLIGKRTEAFAGGTFSLLYAW